MFTTATILTITDTLASARDNALDLLNVAIEDDNADEINTLIEAVIGYQKALGEFESRLDHNGQA